MTRTRINERLATLISYSNKLEDPNPTVILSYKEYADSLFNRKLTANNEMKDIMIKGRSVSFSENDNKMI